MIQGNFPGDSADGYDAFAPGSRIPEWFVDQSMGCSVKVKVELPPHWSNTKLLGVAVCAVVGVKGVLDSSRRPFISFHFDDFLIDVHGLAFLHLSMKSDHMWFGYRSIANDNKVNSFGFHPPGGTAVVSFGILGEEEKLEVRKCGVRLIYYKEEDTDTYCTHGPFICDCPSYNI